MIVAARLVRDRRRSMLWWALGVLALVAFTVSLYPSIRGEPSFDQVVQDLPASVKALVGYQTEVPLTSPAGYLHGRLFALLAPVVMLVFAIGAGAQAIGGAEEAGTLEQLLANPVTRTRLLLERYVAIVALLAGLVVLFTGLLLAMAAAVDALDGVRMSGLLGACAGVFALALLFGTLAFAVGAVTGRRGSAIAVATTAAVAGYLIQTLLAVADVLRPARYVSPWHWYLDRNMLAHGTAPVAIVVPLILSAALLAAGWAVFVRRDLR